MSGRCNATKVETATQILDRCFELPECVHQEMEIFFTVTPQGCPPLVSGRQGEHS